MITCKNCGAENQDGAEFCATCGYDLLPGVEEVPPPLEEPEAEEPPGFDETLQDPMPESISFDDLPGEPEEAPAPPAIPAPTASPSLSQEIKYCTNCGSPNQAAAKFCSGCGSKFPDAVPASMASIQESVDIATEAAAAALASVSGVQTFDEPPAIPTPEPKPLFPEANLVLVRGGGGEGLPFKLDKEENTVGRSEGTITFAEDPFLSPRHATLFFRNDKLFIRDEDSLNGVYMRAVAPVELSDGMRFRIGNQLFQVNMVNQYPPMKDLGETREECRFLGTPLESTPPTLKISQIMMNGLLGSVIYPLNNVLTIGREGCDLSFPTDPYISGRHAQIKHNGPNWHLEDTGSRNGTFVQITEEWPIKDGDNMFLGQQLFKIEMP